MVVQKLAEVRRGYEDGLMNSVGSGYEQMRSLVDKGLSSSIKTMGHGRFPKANRMLIL
jgi:hypothetical protein